MAQVMEVENEDGEVIGYMVYFTREQYWRRIGPLPLPPAPHGRMERWNKITNEWHIDRSTDSRYVEIDNGYIKISDVMYEEDKN